MKFEKKNKSLAKKFRNVGNAFYRDFQFFDALINYNRCLCLAEPGSESIPIAYGNRSAIYLRLKLFDLCLENIQLAIKANCPSETLEKLKKREEECKKMMKTESPNPDDFPINHFKLSYPANPKYPQIANCLELRNDQKFGNYVITNRDLKTGDVIAVEKAFFTTPNVSARLYRCNYCLEDSLLNLLPCTGCAMAMFCSEDCRQKAMQEFHQFECNIENNPMPTIPFLMRFVIKLLRVFDYKPTELKKFLESNKKIATVFDLDFNDSYEKKMVLALTSLRSTVAKLPMAEQFIKMETRRFVNFHPKLKNLWKSHGQFLDDVMLKSNMAMTNIVTWFSKPVNLSDETMFDELMKQMSLNTERYEMHNENAGRGVFPFYALLNSSCDCNVSCVGVGNKLITHVCRPIKKGSQIFRMYCEPFYNFGPASSRRAKLQLEAGFWCDCVACLNDWPTYEGLRGVDPFFQYDKARSLASHEKAKERIKFNNEYIEKNFVENHPTQEVYITMDNHVFELNAICRPSFYP